MYGRTGRGGAIAAPVKRTAVPHRVPPRSATATPPAASSVGGGVEERFSMIRSNPLNFSMLIRLAPDLVDEIKRVEDGGGSAEIKFGANPNNTSSNVISVGNKDFNFTWSRENGDYCDIYEERRSGEDGNGLLVESGGAWRKLNVHRVLDESTKNHVKMRSEEAERKLKSRKAIVLDHGNPSMKNQMKALAAAEVNQWRTPYRQMKEPPYKKKKAELPSGGHHRPPYKSGLPSVTPKVGTSTSPLLSPPEQSVHPPSPVGTSSLPKGHASEDAIPTQPISKDDSILPARENPVRTFNASVQDEPGRKRKSGTGPPDMKSLLESLLKEKPQGMTLKALEKAIGDAMPKSAKQIEPILKKIAVFQAPGRYILKQEDELESSKKHFSEGGSSPEDNRRPANVPEHCSPLKEDIKQVEEHVLVNSEFTDERISEKMDIKHLLPDLFGESGDGNGEAQLGSSSVSGSDSESESSDSESDRSRSRSRSRSKSPVGSGSGSSSDSESDASSSGKEASDEDVDIMSDDDKEPRQILQNSVPGSSMPPNPCGAHEENVVHNVDSGKQDFYGSNVEIEKDFSGDDLEADTAAKAKHSFSKGGEVDAEGSKTSSFLHQQHQESTINNGISYTERENAARGDFKSEFSDSSLRISKSKSKRGSDGKRFEDKLERSKKLKSGNQPIISECRNSSLSRGPYDICTEGAVEDLHKDPASKATSRSYKDVTAYGFREGHNQEVPKKSISGSPVSGRSSIDLNSSAKDLVSIERPYKSGEVFGVGSHTKYSERNMNGGFSLQIDQRETQDGDFQHMKGTSSTKNSRLGAVGDKHSDSHYRKDDGLVEKHRKVGTSHLQVKNSPKGKLRSDMEKFPISNGQGSMLQRELSDLELGELREAFPEAMPEANSQWEKNSSRRQTERKPTSDHGKVDLGKGRPAGRKSANSTKASSPQNDGVPNNSIGLSKKRTPEHTVDDLTIPHPKVMQPPSHIPRTDHTETSSQHRKLADVSTNGSHGEVGGSQGISLDKHADTRGKSRPSASQQYNSKRPETVSTKESKEQRSKSLVNNGKQKDTFISDANDGGRKRESSLDEYSSYSKYEREEPELKGPINDYQRYKDYVEEYREKYDSYCSLNKILESDRNTFDKLGADLELARGRDMDRYYDILRRIKEAYHHCGTRHKRLKKIFIVLHEELQQLKQMIKDYASSHSDD